MLKSNENEKKAIKQIRITKKLELESKALVFPNNIAIVNK